MRRKQRKHEDCIYGNAGFLGSGAGSSDCLPSSGGGSGDAAG